MIRAAVIVCCLLASVPSVAQLSMDRLRTSLSTSEAFTIGTLEPGYLVHYPVAELQTLLVRDRPADRVLSADFGKGTDHWGWFCRAEWKLEEKTRVPLRFRVGHYEAAARLEGK